MSRLVDYARRELEIVGLDAPDSDYGGALFGAVLELMRAFAKQKHSGFSAAQTAHLFNKLARFEPLTPLTGEDSEWTDISDMSERPCWQNKRCPNVFKDADGRAYDINGKVFRQERKDLEGTYTATFTNRDSKVDVAFPYTPVIEYVTLPPEGNEK